MSKNTHTKNKGSPHSQVKQNGSAIAAVRSLFRLNSYRRRRRVYCDCGSKSITISSDGALDFCHCCRQQFAHKSLRPEGVCVYALCSAVAHPQRGTYTHTVRCTYTYIFITSIDGWCKVCGKQNSQAPSFFYPVSKCICAQ